MVGSVLMQRMRAEGDFAGLRSVFFSTSQAGAAAPRTDAGEPRVLDAYDIEQLKQLPILVSTQGGDYTGSVHAKLREAGWTGYWIDAASTLRMREDAVIVLDPVNLDVMRRARDQGIRNFIGGNCTVSLMLMALAGLLRDDLIEWISAMTYQSASGAGAQHMRELIEQMGAVYARARGALEDPKSSALDVDAAVQAALLDENLPRAHFGVPLAGNVIPWIDKDLQNGQSREEWKATAEASKILAHSGSLPVEGLCVRVGAMRCHSQALTIRLKQDLTVDEIESRLASGNSWVRVVPNRREESIRDLSPATVSGKLQIAIGRVRKMGMEPRLISAFTVGDQLLWGAAEPVRRTVKFLLGTL